MTLLERFAALPEGLQALPWWSGLDDDIIEESISGWNYWLNWPKVFGRCEEREIDGVYIGDVPARADCPLLVALEIIAKHVRERDGEL